MTGFDWVLMIVVCLVLGFLGYVTCIPRVDESGDSKKWLRRLCAVVFWWGIVACFAPLVYEFTILRGDNGYIVAIEDNGSYTRHPNGCWEWTKGELHFVSTSTVIYDEFVLDKSDPLSKQTRYELTAEVYDPVLYIKNTDEEAKDYEVCHFFADQFNLLEDPVFAQCLDSKNETQQARLTELAKSWFDPRLQRYGMRVKEARFW